MKTRRRAVSRFVHLQQLEPSSDISRNSRPTVRIILVDEAYPGPTATAARQIGGGAVQVAPNSGDRRALRNNQNLARLSHNRTDFAVSCSSAYKPRGWLDQGLLPPYQASIGCN